MIIQHFAEVVPMQTLAAYLLFVLVLAAFGLSIILGGIILLVVYEATSWVKLLLHEHASWHSAAIQHH